MHRTELQDTVCVCVLFSVFGHKKTPGPGIIQLGGLEAAWRAKSVDWKKEDGLLVFAVEL